jgi:uncharacterized protein involved in exopolysaccharide biosynthesis
MPDPQVNQRADVDVSDEISLAALVNTILRNRGRIMRWMLAGLAISALIAFVKPATYLANASFLPQGTDPSRAGLASLAGEFGVSLPTTGNGALSPDLYAQLAKSRVLLGDIIRDTVTVPELGGKPVHFLDLFEVRGDSPRNRQEKGVTLLMGMVNTSVVKNTGVVQMSVVTRWPSVSLAIVTRLVDGLNNFNQRARQGQAAAERRFVEGRLALARSDLRAAEDRLQQFLQSNKELGSPQVSFERDRLQRDVMLRQQVFTSLTQSLEDARIREVRDTPVITIIETPGVSTTPQPRRRAITLIFGLLFGGLVGIFLSILSEAVNRRRKRGDTDVEELVGALGQVKQRTVGRFRRMRRSN